MNPTSTAHDNVTIHDNTRYHLLFTFNHGTIEKMWKGHIKGGQCDCYGLSNSRGGSERNKILHRYGQKDATRRDDAGLQIWQGMARRQNRIRGVEEATTKYLSETGSGKLTTWAGFPVAHLRPIVSQAVSRRRCTRYLIAILPCPAKQVNGVWVAVGEVLA